MGIVLFLMHHSYSSAFWLRWRASFITDKKNRWKGHNWIVQIKHQLSNWTRSFFFVVVVLCAVFAYSNNKAINEKNEKQLKLEQCSYLNVEKKGKKLPVLWLEKTRNKNVYLFVCSAIFLSSEDFRRSLLPFKHLIIPLNALSTINHSKFYKISCVSFAFDINHAVKHSNSWLAKAKNICTN